ncbi:MAG: hypothetical protein AB7G34_15080 [Hyphomicrobiales bacterium]
MTITPREIADCLKPHINRLLTVAEVALEGRQFEAFRKVVLEELGHKGFEKSLCDLFDKERKR